MEESKDLLILGSKMEKYVDVARVVPILLADMGYTRQSLQERKHQVEDGGRTVDGGCEKVMCADQQNKISGNVKCILEVPSHIQMATGLNVKILP